MHVSVLFSVLVALQQHPSVHHKTKLHAHPSHLVVADHSCSVRLPLSCYLQQAGQLGGTAVTWAVKGAPQLINIAGTLSWRKLWWDPGPGAGLQTRASIFWTSLRTSKQLHRWWLSVSPWGKRVLWSAWPNKRDELLNMELSVRHLSWGEWEFRYTTKSAPPKSACLTFFCNNHVPNFRHYSMYCIFLFTTFSFKSSLPHTSYKALSHVPVVPGISVIHLCNRVMQGWSCNLPVLPVPYIAFQTSLFCLELIKRGAGAASSNDNMAMVKEHWLVYVSLVLDTARRKNPAFNISLYWSNCTSSIIEKYPPMKHFPMNPGISLLYTSIIID